MSQKTFFLSTAFLFTLVSVLHLVRAISGWDFMIHTWMAPIWLSWIVFIVSGFLAINAWKYGSKCK